MIIIFSANGQSHIIQNENIMKKLFTMFLKNWLRMPFGLGGISILVSLSLIVIYGSLLERDIKAPWMDILGIICVEVFLLNGAFLGILILRQTREILSQNRILGCFALSCGVIATALGFGASIFFLLAKCGIFSGISF